MSRRWSIGLVAALAVVLVVMVALLSRRGGVSGVGGRDFEQAEPEPAALSSLAVVPSRANVNPGYAREVAALQHRVAVDPRDTAALLRLARLHQDAHQPSVAVAYYRKYVALAPADRQAWLDLAAASAAAGDWAAALGATDALLARDSLDPAALFNRGAILASQGDTEAARNWWRRVAAQRRDPELAQRASASLRQLGEAR